MLSSHLGSWPQCTSASGLVCSLANLVFPSFVFFLSSSLCFLVTFTLHTFHPQSHCSVSSTGLILPNVLAVSYIYPPGPFSLKPHISTRYPGSVYLRLKPRPTFNPTHTKVRCGLFVANLDLSGRPGACWKDRPSACPHGSGMMCVSQLTCPPCTHTHTNQCFIICCCKVICPPFFLRLPGELTGHEIILKKSRSEEGEMTAVWTGEIWEIQKEGSKELSRGIMYRPAWEKQEDMEKGSKSKGWAMLLTLKDWLGDLHSGRTAKNVSALYLFCPSHLPRFSLFMIHRRPIKHIQMSRFANSA